jgi:hypothetical protein
MLLIIPARRDVCCGDYDKINRRYMLQASTTRTADVREQAGFSLMSQRKPSQMPAIITSATRSTTIVMTR